MRRQISFLLMLALLTAPLLLSACGPGPLIALLSSMGGSDDDDVIPASNTIRVPLDYATIQAAIDAATDGTTVLVADGTYIGTGNKNLDFKGKSIMLCSENGATSCIIDCQSTGRGFYFHSGEGNSSVVDGFTIQNGSTGSGHGGGIYCYNYASPTIVNCIIKDNTTSLGGGGYGGGIYCEGSPRIINCLIINNTADAGGGIGSGYGVHPVVTNCTIANNISNGDGGGIHVYQAEITLNNTIIWGNTATGSGNEIYTGDATAEVNLNYSCYDNSGSDVAGSGTVTPTSCTNDNPLFVDGAGGDYHVLALSPCLDTGSSALVPTDVTTDLDGNIRVKGTDVDMGCYEGAPLIVPDIYATIQSAIYASTDGDTVIVKDGTYIGAGNKDLDFGGRAITLKSENGATSCIIDCQNSGRGFYFHSGEGNDSIVEGFTITNGYLDPGRGAGIHIDNNSSPIIRNLTITNCTALGPSSNNDGMGGGIYINDSSPIISHCVIINNIADTSDLGGYGGGICVRGASSRPVINNCRISNNSSNYIGGGIGTFDALSTINSCTITDNSSRWGGGLCSGNHATTVNNTIVWGNNASNDANEIYSHAMAGAFIMNNCDYDNSAGDLDAAGPVTPTNCINDNPLFVGAPDYRLQETSPCINAGDNSYVTWGYDLAGITRISNGTVDIGAYETFLSAPIADFSATPLDGESPLLVTFTDVSTGNITSWSWNFGDTLTSTVQNPTHQYASDGLYTVSLTVTGPGGTDNETKTDYIFVNTVSALMSAYVATTGNDLTGNGSSGTPFATIQKGIDSVVAGGTVLVMDGTYTGASNKNTDFGGKDIYLRSTGGAENCIIDCEDDGRGFYFHSGETNAAVVEGFTIQNGFSANDNGGAILCNNSSSPIIINCIIKDNQAEYISGPDTGYGGGICFWNANGVIQNCYFSGNVAEVDGGGVFIRDSNSSKITSCIFTSNNATGWGGGFCIRGNSEVANCLIHNNSSRDGGGIYLCVSGATITNCTITDNTSSDTAGGFGCNEGSPTLNNCILWANNSGSGKEIYTYDASSTPVIDTCDYADNSIDIKNIEGNGSVTEQGICIIFDPQFINATAQDYRLQSGSPCINAGSNALVPGDVTTDLDGNPRIDSAEVDIGAYEKVILDVPGDYSTIQSAIDVATDGNTIVVKDGTYTGAGNRDLDFGGREITLKSENGATSTILNCQSSGRGFVFSSSETTSAILEGFTIQNGSANDGAGILCDGASPTITNCIIDNNSTNGGSGSGGGGISLRNGASPVIENCTITNNTGNDSGGGIACWTSSAPTITSCVITDNYAVANGGGVFSSQSSPEIYNCLIANNTSNFGSGGGGICCAASTMTVANCTIANNTNNNNDGGGMFIQTSTVSTTNNIIWGNTTVGNGDQVYLIDAGSSITLDCCCYPDGANDVTGAGTITATNTVNDDPLFKDGGTGNYRLKPGTMCFDAGNSSVVTWEYDLDGSDRITGVYVDIGCYELVVLRVPSGYGTIQAAIDASVDGNVVLVADGTYTGAGNKNLDFGGRKIALRSENGPETTIIDCEGSGRGLYFHTSETNDSVLEGFSVLNGLMDGGGAVYCNNAIPLIRSCIFENNVAVSWGGAVRFASNSHGGVIKNCIIANNSAGSCGGAIDLSQSNIYISDCTITNNTAQTGTGGAINCWASDVEMSNCLISNNFCGDIGGGICYLGSLSPVWINCRIIGNTANGEGGGIYIDGGSPELINCHISDNSTGSNGGGVCVRANATPELNNCLITGNTALVGAASGGGLDCELSFTNLNNCTIAGNAAEFGGGIRTGATAGLNIDNTIIWSNTASTSGHQVYINSGDTVNLDYCDYSNGAGDVAGGGSITPSNCITSDPQFVNAAARDYHLRDSSPCESTGSNALVPGGITTDLDGNERIQDTTVDRGCYEGGWLTVPGTYGTIQAAIDASEDGETILVADGTYTGAGNKDLDFGGRAITLKSENGPESCIIDCQNSGRGINFHSGETNDAIVDGITIINASSPSPGGALSFSNISNPIIKNCIFKNNVGADHGGGFYCIDSSPIITDCVFSDNYAVSGGAIMLNNSCPEINNCLITGNDVGGASSGGGIFCGYGSSPLITSCIIADNTANNTGGGIYCEFNSDPVITNTIIWNNLSTTSSGHQIGTGSADCDLTVTSCCYGDGANDVSGSGTVTPSNCINVDPIFVNTGDGNYRLSGTSPCIDTGDNSLVPGGVTTDLDGDQRLRDGDNPLDGTATVDIGCYEHRAWEDVSPSGTAGVDYPEGRWCHSNLVYDSARGVAVLFGGFDGSTVLGDTWEWNGSTWSDVSPGGTPGTDYPESRYCHAMAYDSMRGIVVLYGGTDTVGKFDDTWEWNGSTWTERASGAVPKPNLRSNHAMAYDSARGVVVLFGGDVSSVWNAETWEWDGSDWTNVSPGGTAGVDYPNGRGYHAMAYDSKRNLTLLHGGWNGSHFGDTWAWDGTDWNLLSPTTSPDNRHAHMMVYDSARDMIVLFGGNTSGGANDETWKWNGTNWIEELPSDKPDQRAYLGMVYDSKRKVIVLFGGAGAGYFDDTWEY